MRRQDSRSTCSVSFPEINDFVYDGSLLYEVCYNFLFAEISGEAFKDVFGGSGGFGRVCVVRYVIVLQEV